MAKLEDFMISRVRVNVIKLFFTNPKDMFYVRQITRRTKEEINAVRRELDRMSDNGLLKSEKRGNRLYYYLNQDYYYYPELLRMAVKSFGLGKQFNRLHKKLGNIKYVVFFGKFVKHQDINQEDVDIVVIGDVVLPELQLLIKEEQERRGREINYTVFPEEEFEFRKKRRDPFIMDLLQLPRVMVYGNEVEFAKREMLQM